MSIPLSLLLARKKIIILKNYFIFIQGFNKMRGKIMF